MDVADLANRLRALAADLPAPGVDLADAHLETALAELEAAARESGADVGRRRLGAARAHLASARRSLAEAGGAVDDYLASIGASGPGAAIPAAATAAPVKRTAPIDPRRWWTERVNELCERTGRGSPDKSPPTKLFNELLRAAADGDAANYHRLVRDAGPGTGTKLPGLAWPLIRTLASEHLGRTPTARDVPVLRSRTADRVRALVPAAADAEVDAVLASACTLGVPDRAGDERDAATTAAVGPALVAALHRLGKSEQKG